MSLPPNNSFVFKVNAPLKITIINRGTIESDAGLTISEVPNSVVKTSATANFNEVSAYDEICPDRIPASSCYSRAERYDGTRTIYVADDEDIRWLQNINQTREAHNLDKISVRMFEQLISEMEKESYFEVLVNPISNKETSCSICFQDFSGITILSCSMCALRVHRKCYGFMYDPEFNKWFCRRCFFSPSTSVECIFCPSKHGAFIQTDTNEWAHVLCAFWIPRVYFKVEIMMDRVMGVEKIRSQFETLKCYICTEQTGFCLTCPGEKCRTVTTRSRNSFHVSCAYEAGFVKTPEKGPPQSRPDPKTLIYCHRCERKDSQWPRNTAIIRKGLEQKKSTLPVLTSHTFPPEVVAKFTELLQECTIDKFVDQFVKYWFKKRRNKNGVPLINTLRSSYNMKPIGKTRKSENNKTTECSLKTLKRLQRNLKNVKILMNLNFARGQLEKQLVYLRRVLTQEILHQLRMKSDTVGRAVKLSALEIEVDKIEKCLVENWRHENADPQKSIPNVFISTNKLPIKSIRETIENVILQNEIVIHEVMHAIEGGQLTLGVTVSLPRIKKYPACLGKPASLPADSRNKSSTPDSRSSAL